MTKVLLTKSPKYNQKLRPEGRSILDLPDEAINSIFGSLKFESSGICLALSCKRLFDIFDKVRDDKVEVKFWNNTSGPWKQQLVISLAKGWVPKDRIRLCYGCWRLMPHGPFSRKRWNIIVANTGCARPKALWELDWEMALWTKGRRVEEVHDNRIRRLLCVFYDQDLRLASARYLIGAALAAVSRPFPLPTPFRNHTSRITLRPATKVQVDGV